MAAMEGGNNRNGTSESVEIPFRAVAGGRRFEAKLRAIRNGGGLISSPVGLEPSGLVVLHPTGSAGATASMQLVGKVTGATRVKGVFVLTWHKLVSPTGVSALLDFLAHTLRMPMRGFDLPRDGSLDRETAYYDFGRHLIFTPERKYHVTQAPSRTPNAATAPPAGGSIRQAMERAARNRPEPASPPPQSKPAATREIIERDDGVVEMFGMKISKEAWERLDTFGGPPKRKR